MDKTLAAFTDPTQPVAPGETYVAYANSRLTGDGAVLLTVRNRQGVSTCMEMTFDEWRNFLVEGVRNL